MKIPLSWLKEYVDISMPVDELAHRFTMAGTEVASVTAIGGWEACCVGQIVKVEPHPNADRLKLCTVDIGSRKQQVICGAPNVAEGQKVPFATVGAKLLDPNDGKSMTLKAATIRGVLSEGMICSEKELGIGENHDGIVVLSDDAQIGRDLSEYLGDHIFDFDVTPNRPDCLSVVGMARECAALSGTVVNPPETVYLEGLDRIEGQASVEIKDPDLCYRYTATLITGIKVEPSPYWMQKRLMDAGMRPINNVVDVTNYVMLELGQPLHAFDLDTIKHNRIVVRRARPGESIASLDGVTRSLKAGMLVIADASDPIALAGIIGAVDTEITESTTTVLLESATFNSTNNRQTAQALGLRTEATIRFEKGLKPELAVIALKRATWLLNSLAGGVVAEGILDVFPIRCDVVNDVTLTTRRLKKVLGLSLPIGQINKALHSLGFNCQRVAKGELSVTVPYWRSDISIEDDLVEEVARVVGYEKIPTTMLSAPVPYHEPQPLGQLREEVRDSLVEAGMQEVINYPLVSHDVLRKTGDLNGEFTSLKIANPLSSRREYLRTSLRPTLLSTLAANQRILDGSICIFEMGRIYLPRQIDLPEEREVVAGVVQGPLYEPLWSENDGHLDFFYAKGVVDAVFERLGVEVKYCPVVDNMMHPGRCASVVINDIQVGLVAEIDPSVVEALDIDVTPVAMFEIDLEKVLSVMPSQRRHFVQLSRFPRATRDLSIVADVNLPMADIFEIMRSHSLVTEALLFDVYTGQNIESGKKSLAFRIYFQSSDRTLTADEVNVSLQELIQTLGIRLGTSLRGA